MPTVSLSTAFQSLEDKASACFIRAMDGTIWPIDEIIFPSIIKDGCIDVVPGTFNPLHLGHESLYNAVKNPHKFFEMAISRYNKFSMNLEEMEKRLEQFTGKAPVILMKYPLFIQKAGILHKWNVCFHIGIDTAIRLLEKSSPIEIQGMRARFIVYDRQMGEDILSLKDLPFKPRNFEQGLSLPDCAVGLSSTQIRKTIS